MMLKLSEMAGMHPPVFFVESIITPTQRSTLTLKSLVMSAKMESKMPDYNSVLTVKQVADLAAYLASVKTWENNAH
jgi:hypothetical protein